MASSPRDAAPGASAPSRLLVFGANHRTTPLEIRETLLDRVTYARFRRGRTPTNALRDLILLKTCNRVEAYVTTSNLEAAMSALDRGFGLPQGSGYTYCLEGPDAAVHLFHVAAGLDSVALGESQVAEQVRRAVEQRPRSWRTGPLTDLFIQAARNASRLRRLAGIDARPASASHAAARYVREVVRIPRPRVTLLGSGKMGRLAAGALPNDATIVVINRDHEKARAIAERLGGRPARLPELREVLPQTDVLITATSAKHRILGPRVLAPACASRDRPLWIIDLGVPRNVDPSAARLEGVRIVTVDDLAPWAGRPPDPAARARVERVVRAEAEAFLGSLRPGVADRVAALRRAAERVRQSEVRLALARMPDATEDEREILEKTSNRLVNRLLHAPTELVRRLQAEGRDDLIGELFDRESLPGRRR